MTPAKTTRLLKALKAAHRHPDEKQRPLDGWLIVESMAAGMLAAEQTATLLDRMELAGNA